MPYTDANLIEDRLWVGSQPPDASTLHESFPEINAVLDCRREAEHYNLAPQYAILNIDYFNLLLSDGCPVDDHENKMTDINAAIDWLLTKHDINKENVLIHCAAGISRSVFICALYMIWSKHYSVAKALNRIHNARPIIQPYTGFIQVLRRESGEQVAAEDTLLAKWLRIG